MKDITNQRFGKLVAIEPHHQDINNTWFWSCKCDCGNEKIVNGITLRKGECKSCGCLRFSILSILQLQGTSTIDFSEEDSLTLYKIFQGMKYRCYSPGDGSYKDYGKRGITICKEWLEDPNNFIKWSLNNNYKKGLQIDRIDNDGPYSPENCRWVTHKENCNNTRRNKYITFEGETITLSQWADKVNISRKVILWRLNHGWTIEKALTTPKGKRTFKDR